MVYQTYHFLLGIPVHQFFAGFVFFSTLTSYSFHWFLTHDSLIASLRIEWVKTHRTLHLLLLIIGIVGSAYFFFHIIQYWHWLMLSAFITFLYSAPKIPHPYFRALRRIAIGKTAFLTMVWVFVTTVLPLLIEQHEWHYSFFLFIAHRLFLIYAICILFDYRDRADDKVAGVRSFITYMSEKNITIIFTVSIALAAICAMAIFPYKSLTDAAILLVPVIITAAIFKTAQRNFSDTIYYFVLDGLMALSAMLMFLTNY